MVKGLSGVGFDAEGSDIYVAEKRCRRRAARAASQLAETNRVFPFRLRSSEAIGNRERLAHVIARSYLAGEL